MSSEKEVQQIKERLTIMDRERKNLLEKMKKLEESNALLPACNENKSSPSLTQTSPAADKIFLFRGLFRGREDIYPQRWDNPKTGKSGYSPACGNEWVRGICNKPKIKCSACPHQAFLPVTDDVIRRHLTGRDTNSSRQQNFTAGVYPLLRDETCWFLAADFDSESWQEDVKAFLHTCREKDVPAYIERSRSGNGAHIWIFFTEAVLATDARKMGSYLLTETMERHPDMAFSSYDRLFPNQDTMPSGGFGNLIALPLQCGPRAKGNSLFLDEDFNPHEDQWVFLASIKRMSSGAVLHLASEAASNGRVTGLRMPVDEEEADEPWKLSPSRKPKDFIISEPLPVEVSVVISDQIYISKEGLPSKLINRLIRIAAFQNPEFYRAQAMRLSTFDKPRIIACAENFSSHIGLPRGCLEESVDLFKSLNVKVRLQDERNNGLSINTSFLGVLDQKQEEAVQAIVRHDAGILSAATGFGKTVIGARIIAERKCNTLVLVHRRQLLDQWVERLKEFLDMSEITIGHIGGGKRKPSGQVDVCLIQSLIRKGEVDNCIAGYGQLIVDECHHLSAVSFEAVARRCKARYILGLTATVARKDGHHPVISMQCGPVRYKVNAKDQAQKRPFQHYVVPRYTSFRMPEQREDKTFSIQEIYAALAVDRERNNLILEDIRKAMANGRSPVILTERKEHVAFLADKLKGIAKNIIVLQGGMNATKRKEVLAQLSSTPETEDRILVATGQYLGEGFDDARLDTLFLVMPISWKGTLAQYAGRLHRLHHNKSDVRIYDYIDFNIPMLARMSDKRFAGYKNLGYEVLSSQEQD
jgi:superfamily II DNA or RNA helicase